MASFVDEAVWAAQDWKWDAHNLTATPADAPQGGKAARKGGDAATTKQGCQVRYARLRVYGGPGGQAGHGRLLARMAPTPARAEECARAARSPLCPSADSRASPARTVPPTVPLPVAPGIT